MSTNGPTVRASAIACEDFRRVQILLRTDRTDSIDPDTLISVHLMTVPEARCLYNTLQDALYVIDARSL
jgi:hypothetical protein